MSGMNTIPECLSTTYTIRAFEIDEERGMETATFSAADIRAGIEDFLKQWRSREGDCFTPAEHRASVREALQLIDPDALFPDEEETDDAL